ncbi:MAG: hypothetical protein LQ339_002407 [Xanthoria mediterranea]|nr:MAG: hypothetical protein LQ339_002407 [Xanthoria mediterranea]
MTHLLLSIFCALLSSTITHAQAPLSAKCNDFNSSATISSRPGVNATLASDIAVALNFERSNWATGSVAEDLFYQVPSNASNATAGSLLKLEVHTNTSLYTIPPTTALSRFLFQTVDFNESAQPASAYILWPYSPRTLADGTFPVVAFAHGTSGIYGEGAPSHIRNLWYHFITPFILALQGYVVVAPDYLGLGVTKDAAGKPISHPYLASTSHANDLFYSVQAAQSAFPKLSKQFVVLGHSQGGIAAWGAAQRQAVTPVEGYLGSIVASPVGNLLDVFEGAGDPKGGAQFANNIVDAIAGIYPNTDREKSLTTLGLQRLQLNQEIQGVQSVQLVLWPASDAALLVKDYWWRNDQFYAFNNVSSIGGKPIAGPMLVLQGDADTAAPLQGALAAINKTCTLYPNSQVELQVYQGADHVPTMYASQQSWLRWIEDRFAGRAVKNTSCGSMGNFTSAMDYRFSQQEPSWYLEYKTQDYETA